MTMATRGFDLDFEVPRGAVQVLSRPDKHLEDAAALLAGKVVDDLTRERALNWLIDMRRRQTKWFLAERPDKLVRTALMKAVSH